MPVCTVADHETSQDRRAPSIKRSLCGGLRQMTAIALTLIAISGCRSISTSSSTEASNAVAGGTSLDEIARNAD